MVADLSETGKEDEKKPKTLPRIMLITLIYADQGRQIGVIR
jgi:hypothetical protein